MDLKRGALRQSFIPAILLLLKVRRECRRCLLSRWLQSKKGPPSRCILQTILFAVIRTVVHNLKQREKHLRHEVRNLCLNGSAAAAPEARRQASVQFVKWGCANRQTQCTGTIHTVWFRRDTFEYNVRTLLYITVKSNRLPQLLSVSIFLMSLINHT